MKIIDTVEIKGERFDIFIDIIGNEEGRLNLQAEVGVTLSDFGKGALGRKIAEAIARKEVVELKTKDFGGESAGNPSVYRDTFTIRLAGAIEDYNKKKMTEAARTELAMKQGQIVGALRELCKATEKAVEFILQFLPSWKYRSNLSRTEAKPMPEET